jgi:hypothetical protein
MQIKKPKKIKPPKALPAFKIKEPKASGARMRQAASGGGRRKKNGLML